VTASDPDPRPGRTAETGGTGVAVVLGASGTIGAAVARHLGAAGWTVVAHGHRTTPAVGDHLVAADLTDWDATRALADAVLADHGPPGALVNCAGWRDDGLFAAQSPDRWLGSVNRTVAAAYHPVRAFLPALVRARRGAVVQVVSVAGQVGSPGQTAYSAAKAAVVAMTRSLAVEYGPRGLRFNAVAPGFLDSALTASVRPEVRAAIEARQALAGTVAAADVAAAAGALVANPSVTGQVWTVDLGLTA
jgi:3-oxoacyl-[acyl-carrier protein] reductase